MDRKIPLSPASLAGPCLLFLLLLCSPRVARGEQKVLLLHAYHQGHHWVEALTGAFSAALDGQGGEITLVVDYLDAKREPSLSRQSLFVDFLRSRYGESRPDLIVAAGDEAFDFVLRNREELFFDRPVLFCGVADPLRLFRVAPRDVTGTVHDVDLEETLRLALRLHPDRKVVAVIGDGTDFGRAALTRLRDIEPRFAWQAEFLPLQGLDADDLAEAIDSLPEKSLLLFLSHDNDEAFLEELHRLEPELPCYTPWASLIRKGLALGGHVIDPEEEGAFLADQALAILGGTAADSIPVRWSSPKIPLFNRARLEALRLSAKELPAGSLVVGEKGKVLPLPLLFLPALGAAFLLLLIRRRRREEGLERQREFIGQFIELLPLPVFYRDEHRRYLFVNEAFVALAGRRREELVGKTFQEVFPPAWTEQIEAAERNRGDQVQGSWSYELAFSDDEGRSRYGLVARKPHRDEAGRLRGNLGVIVDLSELKAREEAFRLSEERLQTALEGAAEGAWDWDVAADSIHFRLEGVDGAIVDGREEMSLDDWRGRLYPQDLNAFDKALADHLEGRTPSFSAECRLRLARGSWAWILVRGRVVARDGAGKALRLAGTLIDISESKEIEARRRETERELRRAAMMDRLTGTLNRKYFEDLLSLQIKRSNQDGSPLSLILFDLDDFKAVNDRYGHLTGDKVLAAVCDLVRSHIRAQDYFGRWGGEEFTLLILGPVDSAVQVAEKLRKLVEEEDFDIEGGLTVSVGVSAHEQGDTVESLAARADEALYRAKQSGKNCVYL